MEREYDPIIEVDGRKWFLSEIDALEEKWLQEKPLASPLNARYDMSDDKIRAILESNEIYNDFVNKLKYSYKEYQSPIIRYAFYDDIINRDRTLYAKFTFPATQKRDFYQAKPTNFKEQNVFECSIKTYLLPEKSEVFQLILPLEYFIKNRC